MVESCLWENPFNEMNENGEENNNKGHIEL